MALEVSSQNVNDSASDVVPENVLKTMFEHARTRRRRKGELCISVSFRFPLRLKNQIDEISDIDGIERTQLLLGILELVIPAVLDVVRREGKDVRDQAA